MSVSKRNTAPSSTSGVGSDMARVDAHVIQPHDYDELPDLSDFDPDEGVTAIAGKPVRGRPALGDRAKRSISLRLDREVIEAFKAGGPGWQTRMHDVLAEAASRLSSG